MRVYASDSSLSSSTRKWRTAPARIVLVAQAGSYSCGAVHLQMIATCIELKTHMVLILTALGISQNHQAIYLRRRFFKRRTMRNDNLTGNKCERGWVQEPEGRDTRGLRTSRALKRFLSFHINSEVVTNATWLTHFCRSNTDKIKSVLKY